MSVTNLSMYRAEQLLSFVTSEKQLFMESHFDMEDEEYDVILENFNDTIEVMKSVFEALN